MSHIIINTLADLPFVLNDSILVTGDQSAVQEEIYHNMWALTFSDELIMAITIEDLQMFFADLARNRSTQAHAQNPAMPVALYLWFDEQALQLRFNILSGVDRILPFGCTVNLVSSPTSVFENFITTTRCIVTEGDVVELFEPGDVGFDDDDDEDPKKYVLDVYVVTLNALSEVIT